MIISKFEDREEIEKTMISINGYPELEKILGNHVFDGGSLIMLSGEKYCGKTLFAMNIAYNIAKSGTPVEYFLYEEDYTQINLAELRKKRKIEDKVDRSEQKSVIYFRNKVKNIPLYIVDFWESHAKEIQTSCESFDIDNLCGEIRSLLTGKYQSLVIIDCCRFDMLHDTEFLAYFNVPKGCGCNSILEVARQNHIVHQLKMLAVELDVTII